MKLQSFPANKGDSFLLSWEHEENKHHLLVDAGITGTYRFIRDALSKTGTLEAIILTHIDYDHIGGMFKLLNDSNLALDYEFEVFMNNPSLGIFPSGSDSVGLSHGITLDKMLAKKGLRVSGCFTGINELNVIDIAGLKIKILSPGKEVLELLFERWNALELYQKHLNENLIVEKVSKPNAKKMPYDQILSCPESIPPWEDDLINSSSIAFIAIREGYNILFLGDSNPELVFNELIHSGYSVTNKLKIDLLKISHHGSKHNTSKNLLSIIDCHVFYISTDGTGPYYHPDRETIVRIAEYSRQETTKKLWFYTNYDLDKSNIITAEEEAQWNINISHKNVLNFDELHIF